MQKKKKTKTKTKPPMTPLLCLFPSEKFSDMELLGHKDPSFQDFDRLCQIALLEGRTSLPSPQRGESAFLSPRALQVGIHRLRILSSCQSEVGPLRAKGIKLMPSLSPPQCLRVPSARQGQGPDAPDSHLKPSPST